MIFRSGKLKINLSHIMLFLLFLGMICLVYTNNRIYKGILMLFMGYSGFGLLYRGQGLRFSRFSRYYTLFFLWCLLSVLWVYGSANGNMLLIMSVAGIILFFLPYYIGGRRDLITLSRIITAATAILFLYVLFTVGVKELTSKRLLVPAVNSNRFGMNLAYASVFCLYLGDRRHKWYRLGIFPIFAMILVSGSKAGIITFMAVLSLYYVTGQKLNAFNMVKTVVIVLFSLCAGLWILRSVPWAYDILGKRLFDFIHVLLTGAASQTGHSTAIREDMVQVGLEFFLKSPLWGFGLDNFRYLYGDLRGMTTYAHNTYIEVLVDLGVTGFLFYYVPRFLLLREVVKRLRWTDKEMSLAFALLCGLLFGDLVSVSFNEIYEQCLLAVVWLIVSRFEGDEREKGHA